MTPPPTRGSAHLRERFQRAQALHQSGHLNQAAAIYQQILRQNPRHADATHLLGLIALQTGQIEQGVHQIERALAINPAYPQALGNLGLGYGELGRHHDALACFDKALALEPDNASLHDNKGTVLRDLKQYEAAIASHDKAIALRPDDAGAFSNRGNALRDLLRYDEARDSYNQAIALQPDFIEACCNRASLLQAMRRFGEALADFDNAIAQQPNHAEAHRGRGNVLRDMQRPQDALISFNTALALNPQAAVAHNDQGNALYDLRQFHDALASFQRALKLQPAFPQALNNQGNALQELQRFDEALTSYTEAIALRPDYAEAYYNRGNTLVTTQRLQAALGDYGKAVALKPDHAAAHRARGIALATAQRYGEAITALEHARRLEPDTPWLPGDILFVKRRICDWTTDDSDVADLEQAIQLGRTVASPFTIASITDSPAIQKQTAEIFARTLYPPNPRLGPLKPLPSRPKIHVAYVSADFRDHPMMHLMAGLFECHDKSRFELTAFSLGPDTGDAYYERVRKTFDRFIDVRPLPDERIAALGRDLHVDIAIDLSGFTMGFRTGLFSYRTAPVQAYYLGFPTTMGISYFDYIIADPIVIPPDDACHYTEHVVRLPNCYQANDHRRAIADRIFTRSEQDLPDDAFVFCCFNNSYKITPQVFGTWMRILARVPNSVLWLYEDNADATYNLRHEAAVRNIAPERLVFAKRLPVADHLARHRLADLFLDTMPYNAHTTASDALWAGLPVLTSIGTTFPSRVAASLLNAIDLPELITTTPEQYEARAIELATNPTALQSLRAKLWANRLTAPLFDTLRFTRDLEAAYEAMYARANSGLPPAPIQIPVSPAGLHDPTTIRR